MAQYHVKVTNIYSAHSGSDRVRRMIEEFNGTEYVSEAESINDAVVDIAEQITDDIGAPVDDFDFEVRHIGND